MTAEIFQTLNSLISITKKTTIKYFDDLFNIFLDAMQDMAFVQKRIEATKCMSNLVRTSGLVVFVNYRYFELTDLLFVLFQVEPHKGVKMEIMRLIGILGAVDHFHLFRLKKHHLEALKAKSQKEIVELIQTFHKSRFYFESKLKKLKEGEN